MYLVYPSTAQEEAAMVNRRSVRSEWGILTPGGIVIDHDSKRPSMRFFYTDFPLSDEELFHISDVAKNIRGGILRADKSYDSSKCFVLYFEPQLVQDEIKLLSATYLNALRNRTEQLSSSRGILRVSNDLNPYADAMAVHSEATNFGHRT